MRILLLASWLLMVNGAATLSAATSQPSADAKTPPKSASEQKSPIEEIKEMQRDVSALFQGSTGRYAREFLEKSKTELQNAQVAAESGKTAQARRSLELAGILVQRAKAVTDEQESVEKTAIKRAELKKLEERIEVLLKGKDQ